MNIHADKTKENKNQSHTHNYSQQQSGSTPVFQLEDNRREADRMRELQELADNSPHAWHGNAVQEMANRSVGLQAKGLGNCIQLQSAQLQGLEEDEELPQGKFDATQLQSLEEDEKLLQGKFAVAQRVEGVPINDDPSLEREADLMGAQAMRAKVAPGTVRRQEAEPTAPNRTGLPDQLKAGIENLSGLSLDDVHVYNNSSKPARFNALAYTRGSDIHVGPGQERHLPHEAWHVVQQKQGRVQPAMQMKEGVPVDNDEGLEREADGMGQRAAHTGSKTLETKASHPSFRVQDSDDVQGPWADSGATTHYSNVRMYTAAPTTGGVIQKKMGFELELPVLVDIDGRPVPEKRFLGQYGAQNLELQVDQNGDVAGPTPRPAAEADFWSATSLPPFMAPIDPTRIENLGAYDLPQRQGWETRVDLAANALPAADTRTGLPSTMLDVANWQRRTARNRFSRPPVPSDIGMINTELANLDNLIPAYATELKNWEPARAVIQLNQIIFAATNWLAANNNPPSLLHPFKRARYHRGRAKIQALLNEANAHLLFWNLPANAIPPVGLERQYRDHLNPAWGNRHPMAGAGTERYASILEIVTRPYEVETPAGMVGLIAAMTEANQLAMDIEGATNNFNNRALFNTIAQANIFNPLTYIGNDHPDQLAGPQSTEASIQSTFAIDLTQIPSLMKSTVAILAPQRLFGLKHQGDREATMSDPKTIHRAELEMALAVNDATFVINNVKAQIILAGGVAPTFVNLRGLVTLVCQYLRLGRYWNPGGVQVLDKNLTDLLSRTDLALIFAGAVPNAEKTWLQAAPANMANLITQILARTNRTGASVLLNNPNETQRQGGVEQFDITCRTFVSNVFTQPSDGITPHFGGFKRRPLEDIDPLNQRAGDAILPTVPHPHRMAPVFEMRNMMPKLDGARFPRADWVLLATYMATMIARLNSRTQAQAIQDRRVREHTGLAGPTDFDAPENNW